VPGAAEAAPAFRLTLGKHERAFLGSLFGQPGCFFIGRIDLFENVNPFPEDFRRKARFDFRGRELSLD
jgi:hypothetical protein